MDSVAILALFVSVIDSISVWLIPFLCGCSPEHRAKLIAECQAADAVVLTYACDRPATLERLSTFWLPELRRLQVRGVGFGSVVMGGFMGGPM
jgi:hypothetical protein